MNINFKNKEYKVKIWEMEHLGSKVVIDTETTIAPFTQTPDLVLFQAYGGGNEVFLVRNRDINLFLGKHYDSILIAHNAPFDVDVIHKYLDSRALYDKYDRCLIHDTNVMYKLLHLAASGFVPFKTNLAFLADRFLNVELKKDERRENFGQFLNKEIEEIPEEYVEYACLDVIATYQVYNKLLEYISNHDKYNTLLSLDIQVKGDLALSHIHKNGIGFDTNERDEWLAQKDSELEKLGMWLGDWGLIRGVPGYKEQYRYVVEDVLKLDVPYRYKKLLVRRSKSGSWFYDESGMIEINNKKVKVEEGQGVHGEPSLSSQREDLEIYYNIPFIKHYLDYMEIEKATSFVRDLDSHVNPRYNLLVNTGRTSCSSPNFQQLPKMGGIREMFKAKEGHTFIITDYSAIELATLAQVLYSRYNRSVMRQKINQGIDLHRYYAATYHSKPEAQVKKEERQMAKAPNFGFPGGLGCKTFIQFSKGYGLDLDMPTAQRMKEIWFRAFPEVEDYMKDEKGFVFTLTGRKRGKTSYCAEKNTPFQGLAADGAKLALYNLDKAGFVIRGFVHDEIICEVPEELAVRKLKQQEELMVSGMKQVVKDVAVRVESAISPFYTK